MQPNWCDSRPLVTVGHLYDLIGAFIKNGQSTVLVTLGVGEGGGGEERREREGGREEKGEGGGREGEENEEGKEGYK